MAFKSPRWRFVAIALSALNLVGVGAAAAVAEPWHAAAHATLGLAFGVWSERLRRRRGAPGDEQERLDDVQTRLDQLELEMSDQRRELLEAQERLDFAERLLAREAEAHRLGQQH